MAANKRANRSTARRHPEALIPEGFSEEEYNRLPEPVKKLVIRLSSPRLRAEGTVISYCQTANRFSNLIGPVKTPTDDDFRRYFIARRRQKISERTLNKEFVHLKKLAEANGWNWNFTKEDAPKSKQKPFQPSHTLDEIQKLIMARHLFSKSEMFYLAWATTWGCRREELCRIKKSDYAGQVVTIHIAKRGVDVDHLIPDALKPIFAAYHFHVHSPQVLSAMYHRACEKAGIRHPKGWGWHCFRRTVKTALEWALAADRLPQSWAAVYIGWSTLSVGREYSGSDMAGLYDHSADITTDRWYPERRIIKIHPFLPFWEGIKP
jgi:integrase